MQKLVALTTLLLTVAGCTPTGRLSFPYRKLVVSPRLQWFDMNHDGLNDFAISFDQDGRVDAVAYDDNQDGQIDRRYRLADYTSDSVPHLVILLDSIPYEIAAQRYAAGEFRWFFPPQKVIAPFPSMTEVSYTALLHASPLGGAIDSYYDRARGTIHSGLAQRMFMNYRDPWERCVHYSAQYTEGSESYLQPRAWYAGELERARRVLESSADSTTYVYLTSASGMVCRYGKAGANEVLDGAAQLCLQLLYDTRGAIKISLMADHGHNLMPSRNINVLKALKADGFNVTSTLKNDNDIVLEISGLVTYASAHTAHPARAAEALLKLQGIQHAFYMENNRLIVRDVHGDATIERNGERLRYTPHTHDVLGYQPVLDQLRVAGKLDRDGYATRDDFFLATADHNFPDAAGRLWDAFHGQVRNTPDLMFTTFDGYCAGLPYLENFITMQSTHGSLNQMNSATFVMTMIRRLDRPLRSAEVLPAIVHAYAPTTKPGR